MSSRKELFAASKISLDQGQHIHNTGNYQNNQVLTAWVGDTPSLLAEMKRRASVRTDQDLARFMGASQSTVSGWRRRGTIPESAILQFEQAFAGANRPRLDSDHSLVWAKLEALKSLLEQANLAASAISDCIDNIMTAVVQRETANEKVL